MNKIIINPTRHATLLSKCASIKKVIIPFFILLTFLTTGGCEKSIESDNSSQQGEDATNANLVLRVQMTRGAGNELPWKTLMFEIYKDNKKIKDIVQHEGDSNYGTANVQLTPATYQVLVLAHSAAGNPSRPRPTEIEFTNQTGYTDVFYSYGDIKVETEKKEYEITLQRATSLVRFRTKDAVPEQVKSMMFVYTGGSAKLDATTGYGNEASTQKISFNIEDSMIGKPLQVDLYTFKRENSDKIKLTVRANKNTLDASDIAFYKKKDFEISLAYREISDFSGYFFSENPGGDENEKPNGNEETNDTISSSFSIKVDTAWTGINYYTY